MVLTKNNYFTPENQYLTNSKLKDYLKSKEYFYEKHVKHSVEKKETPALVLGSMVDDIVTCGWKTFEKNYKVVTRRNLKNPPKAYTEVTQAVWDEAVEIGTKVRKSQAFKDLKGFRRQVLLKYNEKIGLFKGLAGLLDFLKIEGNIATIVDLKTSNTCHPKKYLYHSFDYGYFWQLAFYAKLVLLNYEEVNIVRCYHVVVEKDADKIYPMNVFEFSQVNIAQEMLKIDNVLEEINTMKARDYKDEIISFKDVIHLGITPSQYEKDEAIKEEGWKKPK